jgi:O-antigen ligase
MAAAAPHLPLSERLRNWTGEAWSPQARRMAAFAGLVLLGAAWGVAIGMGGMAALILFLAAVAAVFCLGWDFRAGVALLIVIMPISQSYVFPHEMFGITGLNPLNLLLAATLFAHAMRAAGKGELKHFVPRPVLWLYILPIAFGAWLGMDNAGRIPTFFRDLEMIYFSDAPGYLRDMFFKPMLFVLYALLISAAVLHSREPAKFVTPLVISIFVMASASLIYFILSGFTLSQLAGTSARQFYSALGMHANDLGRLYACAYALLLFTWDRSGNMALKSLLMIAMVLVVLALLVTFSRGAFFGFILVNAIYLFSRRRMKTLVLAALAIPVALYFTPGAVWYRMSIGLGESLNEISAGRVGEIWAPLLPTLLDSPVWGNGLGSIMWSRPMIEGRLLQVGHPHNGYLQAYMDTGAIGLVLLVLFWAWTWRRLRFYGRDTRLTPDLQGFFEGAAAGLAAFLVAALAGSSLFPVPEQAFLWLAVGMMFGVMRRFGDHVKIPGSAIDMCGITGYWIRRGDPAAWLGDLGASVATLRNRGPDDSGVWVRPGARVALGHTRLAILDLSASGHQPMRTADGELTLVFNGEVYNFAAIRAELEGIGHRFRSSGDTEVVLAALRQWGMAAVDRFVGMFAIAVWNEREHRLMLLRDRMGVKPLYYAWNGSELWFGSELKALRAFRAWRPELDRDALGEYLQYGYVSAPRSIYRDVRKLMPGHWLELGEVGEPVAHRYWSPFDEREPLAGSEADLERELESLMIDAFRLRTVADVPVGVFLSGGIDSSAVAAILQRHGGGDVRTFTIGFHDPRFDEAVHARQVAAHLGTIHTEQVLTPGPWTRCCPNGPTSSTSRSGIPRACRPTWCRALPACTSRWRCRPTGATSSSAATPTTASWPSASARCCACRARRASPARTRWARSPGSARAPREPRAAADGAAPRRAPQPPGADGEAARDAARGRALAGLRPRDDLVDAVGDRPAAGRAHHPARIDRIRRREFRGPDVAFRPAPFPARRCAGQGRPHHDGLRARGARALPRPPPDGVRAAPAARVAPRAARAQAPVEARAVPLRAAIAPRAPETGFRRAARELAARRPLAPGSELPRTRSHPRGGDLRSRDGGPRGVEFPRRRARKRPPRHAEALVPDRVRDLARALDAGNACNREGGAACVCCW